MRESVGGVLLVREGVLARADCRKVIEAMAGVAPVAGAVLRAGRDEVDARLRVCAEHVLTPELAALVGDAMRSAIGPQHAGLALDGPKFVSYGPGQFFRAHRDRSDDPSDPAVVRGRRLTLVCLLNDGDDGDGLPAFDGGALVVYDPRPANVKPKAGTVVAFDADLMHEVRPVRGGIRYSAIAWLFEQEAAR